jgi:hypothetical protein
VAGTRIFLSKRGTHGGGLLKWGAMDSQRTVMTTESGYYRPAGKLCVRCSRLGRKSHENGEPYRSGLSTTESTSEIQRLMKVSNMGTVKSISPQRGE